MDKQDFISLILYYGRGKFFHSMQKTALDGLAKFPAQVEFRLFNGIALTLGNRVQEAIRELNPLKNEQEFGLAAILALIYSHKHCNVIDKEAISNLETKLKAERRNLNANASYYAGVFLFLTNRMDKAREYADKALKLNDALDKAIILKAWTELLQNNSINNNILISLEKVLNKEKNIDASLGQVKYFQLKNDFDNAIVVLNKLSVRFPELNIPLIEKMETQLSCWDWDHAFETALRIVNLEPTNISALRIKGLILICRDGNTKAGAITLQQLLAAVERVEMGNYGIIMQTCQLFSRICSRNKEILNITLKHIEKIVRLNPGNVEYMTELGYQNILFGNNSDAVKCFRSVTKVDNNFFLALSGLTICQIIDKGITEQVRQQIEFLNEIQGIDKNPILLFLISKITEGSDKAFGVLVDAAETHLTKLKMHAFGVEYLLNLDPDFLLQITTDLLNHSPVQIQLNLGISLTKDSLQVYLKHCMNILDVIIRACPGHLRAIYMKAKLEFLCGELTIATITLNRILSNIDVTFTDAYLLLAQVQITQKQFPLAKQSLEICLSHNFGVRENPLYRLLLGIVQKNQQQYSEALKNFVSAMQIIGSPFVSEDNETKLLTSSNSSVEVKTSHSSLCGFTMSDKLTLYLELINVYSRLGELNESYESERLLQVAMDEFSNTPQEGRLVIANAEIMLQKGDVSKAIDLLSAIQPGQSYFIQAKTQLAYAYLNYKKDRIAFAKCFKNLVEKCPEIESFLMLGEAYMSIQEPDLAVDAFEKALSINPNDSLVASKLGRAYVKTHQYNAAIRYYHEALKNPDHAVLKLDLAELYLKLKQYQNAADVLEDNDETKKINETDIAEMQMRTKQLLLLARIQEKSGNINLSLRTLKEARDNQYRVQKRISIEQNGNGKEQNKILSNPISDFKNKG